jgi:hypothetical protein
MKTEKGITIGFRSSSYFFKLKHWLKKTLYILVLLILGTVLSYLGYFWESVACCGVLVGCLTVIVITMVSNSILLLRQAIVMASRTSVSTFREERKKSNE